jgi:hypothetical protein
MGASEIYGTSRMIIFLRMQKNLHYVGDSLGYLLSACDPTYKQQRKVRGFGYKVQPARDGSSRFIQPVKLVF